MDWMYLFYFLLAALLFFGCRACRRGEWNEEFTSRGQTKILQGFMALCVALHHMAQKTCAPWHNSRFIVHGMDVFVPLGFLFVAVFFFCSGLGLYKSLKTKPDYLRGFFRKRILPIIVAFYLSEFIYTGIRLLMGEKMDALTVVWYLSGLHMANFNVWYVIAIIFFYLAFWGAFRLCKKREGLAILLVTVFVLAYTVLGAYLGHPQGWWMRGEWWYNSVLLFPLGLLFGRFERPVTKACKKAYWVLLPLFFAGIFLSAKLWHMAEGAWGYYWVGQPLQETARRLGTAASQWLVCICFVGFCFLLMMKVRFGNKALKWLGAATLEFYLMHGVFVELFGYDFLEFTKSLTYIRKVPLYIQAVLACSVAATILFHFLWKGVMRLPGLRPGKPAQSPDCQNSDSASASVS
ncbi:MAG: acyltransferase [Clostridia bacterium]|nr:acyltransferase [Clostridia bacterium]